MARLAKITLRDRMLILFVNMERQQSVPLHPSFVCLAGFGKV